MTREFNVDAVCFARGSQRRERKHLSDQTLEQLGFEFRPARRLPIANDLKTTVPTVSGSRVPSSIFGPINHPPIVFASEYTLQSHNRMHVAQQVKQLVSVKDILKMEDPTTRVVARAVILKPEWLTRIRSRLLINVVLMLMAGIRNKIENR